MGEMKMKTKKNAVKKILDLDAALQEVAQKLKPAANMPACGNTNISNTRFTSFYNCSCCSDCKDKCVSRPDSAHTC
jgi:hypothetical protein